MTPRDTDTHAVDFERDRDALRGTGRDDRTDTYAALHAELMAASAARQPWAAIHAASDWRGEWRVA